MMHDFLSVTMTLTFLAIWITNLFLTPGSAGAFVAGNGQPQELVDQQLQIRHVLKQNTGNFIAQPLTATREAVGTTGLFGFGVGFGVLVALLRGARSRVSASRVMMQAEGADIAVKEKTETKPVSYLENIPRTIVEKKTLDKLLSTLPKEQWDDPPEDSLLYTLKLYAETYGEGKATKMGWWDFWYLRITMPESDDFYSGEDIEWQDAYWRQLCSGKIPMWIPGAAPFIWDSGATIQWRGPEMFAGDQVQTPVTNGGFAVQYVNAMAFYREGLKPWQRGLEIGMAHGYFLIGPFVALGPLRNTPEAATVGLLCGCAIIGIVSTGGLLYGATVKPTLFDKEDDPPAAGFQEMINWHAVGGLGGAGFAHALLTVFGS